MSIIDSITQARQKGANDDQIVSEILKQNPDKSAVFTQAQKMGANSSQILDQVVKQNNPADTTGIPTAQELADQRSADQYKAILPYSSDGDQAGAGYIAKNVGKSVVNLPSSFANFLGNLGNAIIHPINTITGLGKAAIGAGEALGDKIRGQSLDDKVLDPNEQAFYGLTKSLQERYGSLDNLTRTSVNDPFGLGSDIFAILSGGAALTDSVTGASKVNTAIDAAKASGATAEELAGVPNKVGATAALDKGISAVASPVIKAGSKTAQVAGNLAAQTLGVGPGSGASSIKAGFNSGVNGTNTFVKAMRGEFNPDDVIRSAQDAVQNIADDRRTTYLQKLDEIGQNTKSLDISPATNELDKQLENFGITVNKDGELDFSRSSIANNGTARSDVQGVYDTVNSWGTKAGDRTPVGVDTLKKQLGDFYSPSGSARAFVQAVKSKVSGILNDQVPGYNDLTSGYRKSSDLLDDIKSATSIGGKAKVDTIFSKLTNAMKNDNELRLQILNQVSDLGKEPDLLDKIAGINMQSYVPKGLVGSGIDAIAAFKILTTAFNPHLLPLILSTSPRLVGEFVHALGVGYRYASMIAGSVDTLAKHGIILAPATSRTNQLLSPRSGAGQENQ